MTGDERNTDMPQASNASTNRSATTILEAPTPLRDLIDQLTQAEAPLNGVIIGVDVIGDDKLPEAWVLHIPVTVGTLYLAIDPQGDGQLLKSTADGFWSWVDATDEIDELTETPEFAVALEGFLAAD